MSQLAVSVGPYVSEATEQHTLALRLVNRGKQLCVLDGYPRVAFYDARGTIDFRIRHGGDQMIAPQRPMPVRVRPGGSAFVLLNKNACVEGVSRTAARIELLTHAGGATSFSFPTNMAHRWRIPYSCTTVGDPGEIVTLSPFVPSVRAGLNS